MEIQFSQSEENGIKAMPNNALNVYSVGVSTVGSAEIHMAALNPNREVIATTIDIEGAAYTQKCIDDTEYKSQITIRIEDVSAKLSYSKNFFDYIYARLVLHYLPKSKLKLALTNLYRILKPGCKIFIVVRSTKAPQSSEKTSTYDEKTGLTTYLSSSNPSVKHQRFFHTPASISKFVASAGFQIEHVKEYDEKIYSDFKRKIHPHDEPLIELVAIKPN